MIKCNFFVLNKISLNFTLALVPTKSNEALSILLFAVGSLILSLDNPLDFHDKILPLLALTVFKYH